MSNYDYEDPLNLSAARELLASIWEEAAAIADSVKNDERPRATFAAMAAHIREDRIEGLHVYPAKHGGWHADLTFKDFPAGIARVMGSPKNNPCPTHEDAMKFGVTLVATAINIARDTKWRKEDKAAFRFHDMTFKFPLDQIEAIAAILKKNSDKEPGVTEAVYQFEALEEHLKIGEEFTGKDFERLDQKMQEFIVYSCCVALAAGMPRWPETVDAAPRKLH